MEMLKAIEIGQISVVRRLILEGHDVNEFSESMNCPLLEAASRNDTAIVKLLMEHGANPNVEDVKGRSPLSWAQTHGNTLMGKMLGLQSIVGQEIRTTKAR